MPKKGSDYKVKGELYRDEDGRLMVLEDKTAKEIDIGNDLDEFMGRIVTFTVKESKEV